MPRPALLCDIGNVLVSFDFTRAAERFASQSPLARHEVLRALEPLKVPLESGQLQGDEFVRRGMELIGFTGSTDEFRRIWCEIFGLNEAMERTLAALAARVPMFLLSNTSDLHKDYLLATFPVFRHFVDGVFSYLARSMKPDEAIFRVAIEQFDLDPSLTFFIDDLAPNIETARRLGFQCHHYHMSRHKAIATELEAWLAKTLQLL